MQLDNATNEDREIMKLVTWTFQNLSVVMMEDENGVLYTTSAVLATALGVTTDSLRMAYKFHREEFDALSVTDAYAKDFLNLHRVELGIQRLRDDMHIWSEGDMILHAMYCQTSQGRGFRKDLIEGFSF